MDFKNKIVSKFLIDKYNLWLWDFDDTLIDTYTYYIKNMEPEYILNRTLQDLDEDLPCWKYFKKLINHLVKHNVKVGIVSFGTYKIIQAYMDRIFGFNQKIFTKKNIIALCRNNKGIPTKFYPNKNDFINTLMDTYNISDKKKVILFDDLITNVSSALDVGIFAVKIKGKSDNRRQYTDPDDLFNKNTLLELDNYLQKKNDPLIVFDNCNDYYLKKYGTIGYRKIYGDIINQQQSEKEAELTESILENTKKTKHKVPDFSYDFKPKYIGDYSLLDNFRKQKICKKIIKHTASQDNNNNNNNNCKKENVCKIENFENFENIKNIKKTDLDTHKNIYMLIIITLCLLTIIYFMK